MRTRRTWNPQRWIFLPVVMMAFCGVILFMMSKLMDQQGKLRLTAENPTIRLGSLDHFEEFCSAQQIVIGVILQTLDQESIVPWIKEVNQMRLRTYIFGDHSYEYLETVDVDADSGKEIAYYMWEYFYERFYGKKSHG